MNKAKQILEDQRFPNRMISGDDIEEVEEYLEEIKKHVGDIAEDEFHNNEKHKTAILEKIGTIKYTLGIIGRRFTG